MKNTINTIVEKIILASSLFLSTLPVYADDIQNSINLDYFRTPEASVFMKYGEESVNEYTGTADISVPLYTIKCKDIEIPLVLRYDASGIKVEQEASWVGLGWNLMVGGCINYVCAGGHDMYGAPDIDNKVWTEYLTSDFSISTSAFGNTDRIMKSQTRHYKYNANDKFNWMAKYPYVPDHFIISYQDYIGGGWGMMEYLDWGWGERDFYSVNVMGKSFMFFIDPFTLNVYIIGKAGEDFLVEREYQSEIHSGIGRQPDVFRWKITDSDGYIYLFTEGDKFLWDSRLGKSYTSCWYLTKIKSPMGEEVEFKYTSRAKQGRTTRAESYVLPFGHNGGLACCSSACNQIKGYNSYLQSENSNMSVTSHYLSEIKTSNQIVTFDTSNSDECSGKKLNSITVQSHDGTEIKKIIFSYSSFTPSNVGGNYAPQDTEGDLGKRLKLDNVKEKVSSKTLTTSFSYNSKQLPSKRSCAQDFWGYFNGKENKLSETIYTMIPTPQTFMSNNYAPKLSNNLPQGADRYSSGEFMDACMLTRVDYPTGGYTIYEYSPNSIYTKNFKLSDIYREKRYEVSVQEVYTGNPTSLGMEESPRTKFFSLYQDATFDLTLRCNGDSKLYGNEIIIEIRKLNPQTYNYDLFFEKRTSFPSSDKEELTLPAGEYLLGLTLTSRPNLQYSITCDMNGWYNRTMSSKIHQLTVGGLRIKRIRNYDIDNSLVNLTTYDYDEGVLLNKIETIDYSLCYNLNPVGSLPGTHSVEVFTITPGHPRLPAFYESCCPGIVGYSKITKSKYNAKDHLEKCVVTSYRNYGPETMLFFDYNRSFDNGLIESQEVYDESYSIIAKTVNTYEHNIVDFYATNIVTKKKYLNNGSFTQPAPLTLQVYDFPSCTLSETSEMTMSNPNAVVYVWRYPYVLSRAELTKTTITEYCKNGSSIVKTRNYSYNERNHRVSQIDETTSLSSQIRRTRLIYSADRTDDICKTMADAHRLNDVVETKNILVENGLEKCIDTQHTTYANFYSNNDTYYLPHWRAISIGDTDLKTRAIYSYDEKGNVCSVKVNGMETVYIWSYNAQYPIAKIEGLTYDIVKTAIGESTIINLLAKAVPSIAEVNSIRNAIKNIGGHITTYTYKPLIGIETMTQPNGMKITYKYDGFGRLEKVIDHNGSVISTHNYHYKE